MATDPYETRSDTPLPRKGGGEEPDATVQVPLPASSGSSGPSGPSEEPDAAARAAEDDAPTVSDTSRDFQMPEGIAPPPATSYDVPVAGSPRPPQTPPATALPSSSPYAQPPGVYGTQAQGGQPSYGQTQQDPQGHPQPPQGQQPRYGQDQHAQYGQGGPQDQPQYGQQGQPQYGVPPQPQYPQGQPGGQQGQPPYPGQQYGPGPGQPQYGQPYAQGPYVPQQGQQQPPQGRPVPPSWHRQHYAIGLFLLVYGVVNLALGFLGFDARKDEVAEYLSEGVAGPVVLAVKALQALLLAVVAAALVRRRSVLLLPPLLAWTAAFAILAVLDLLNGLHTTLLEHLAYGVVFAILLFLSYALSVRAGTAAAQTAQAAAESAPPQGAPAAPQPPQSLSRTQEFALNTLNRFQRR
ncbi:hypothetical protein LO762_31295 [Actinocorallia sp. API 0066]|uniref:hypothetical protein n=1 Tax=Actinocorallia sp. API 0066 TaxID=2896846 RepID=UPI001E3EB5B9|nr:hypothetical protein [Actinocorallia sp. API 0066]MCD0453637.1 hypothetical protein [Actinocorallia sp. API 0066]